MRVLNLNSDTLEARDYNPSLGRFISEDPIGFQGQDANLYRYAYNSPTQFTDSSGLLTDEQFRLEKKVEDLNYIIKNLNDYLKDFKPKNDFQAKCFKFLEQTRVKVEIELQTTQLKLQEENKKVSTVCSEEERSISIIRKTVLFDIISYRDFNKTKCETNIETVRGY